MELELAKEAIAFLWSVAVGALLGAANDLFRVGRILKRPCAFRVFWEDLLLSLIIAFATFGSLALTHDGQVRLFLLLGELCGFILYFNTLGRMITAIARLIRRLLQFLKGRFLALGRRFLKIAKKIMNFLKKPFIFLLRWCRIILHHFERRKAQDGKERKSAEPRGSVSAGGRFRLCRRKYADHRRKASGADQREKG